MTFPEINMKLTQFLFLDFLKHKCNIPFPPALRNLPPMPRSSKDHKHNTTSTFKLIVARLRDLCKSGSKYTYTCILRWNLPVPPRSLVPAPTTYIIPFHLARFSYRKVTIYKNTWNRNILMYFHSSWKHSPPRKKVSNLSLSTDYVTNCFKIYKRRWHKIKLGFCQTTSTQNRAGRENHNRGNWHFNAERPELGSQTNTAAGLGNNHESPTHASLGQVWQRFPARFKLFGFWCSATFPRNGVQVDHTCLCLWPDTWQDKLHYVYGYA